MMPNELRNFTVLQLLAETTFERYHSISITDNQHRAQASCLQAGVSEGDV